MKKIVIVLLAVLSGFSTYAFEKSSPQKSDSNSIKIEFARDGIFNGEVEKSIYFAFSNTEEMKSFDINPYLNNLTFDDINEEFCTGDLRVTVRVGFGQNFIEFQVTIKDVPCEDIIAKAKEYKEALNNM